MTNLEIRARLRGMATNLMRLADQIEVVGAMSPLELVNELADTPERRKEIKSIVRDMLTRGELILGPDLRLHEPEKIEELTPGAPKGHPEWTRGRPPHTKR